MNNKKKKDNIIKPTSSDFVDDASFQCSIVQHVNVFGFCNIIPNVIEAYRQKARCFNKQADELEKKYLKVK